VLLSGPLWSEETIEETGRKRAYFRPLVVDDLLRGLGYPLQKQTFTSYRTWPKILPAFKQKLLAQQLFLPVFHTLSKIL